MVHELVLSLSINRNDTILDFGCAKGFVVMAFRMMHYNAYGIDISEYALNSAPENIRPYLAWYNGDIANLLRFIDRIDPSWVIAKDVFEHIEPEKLSDVLQSLNSPGRRMFVIVPLGNGKVFNASENNLDKSHRICQNLDWWGHFFHKNKWDILAYRSQMDYIKQDYNNIPNAHAFFKLKSL
ncbi:MAG: class I SAM-dependent methyltransferase [Anaerolineales bacterium]|nr:class I SAM-dependent methyltransferase [Anaerolineales bacterium]